MNYSLHHPLCFDPDTKITSSFSLSIIGISVLGCHKEINGGIKGKEPQKLQSHMANHSFPSGCRALPRSAALNTVLLRARNYHLPSHFSLSPQSFWTRVHNFDLLLLPINTSGLSPQLPSTRGFWNPHIKLKLILYKTWLCTEAKKAVTQNIPPWTSL